MPRTARLIVPNYPHHIIQRGHNRQVVFANTDDYLYYLENLQEWKEKLGCLVYGYCLMTNHVHLIVNPGEDANNIGLLMKRLAGRQTRYINKKEKRTGSLWEGRYKSSTISTDEYLLACCRYVELNPVRAGLVADPAKYRWSSYGSKCGEREQALLDFDPCYLELSDSPLLRAKKYAQWVAETTPEGELELIRGSLQRGQLTGSNRFVEEIERKLEKRIDFRKQGRPKNKSVPLCE